MHSLTYGEKYWPKDFSITELVQGVKGSLREERVGSSCKFYSR